MIAIPTLPSFEPRFKSSVVAVDQQQNETHTSTAPPPDYFVTDLIDMTAETPPTAPNLVQSDVWSLSTSPDKVLNEGHQTSGTGDAWMDCFEPGPSGSMATTNGEDVWQLLKEKDALVKQLQDDIVKQQIEHNNEILQMQKELMSLRDQLRNS